MTRADMRVLVALTLLPCAALAQNISITSPQASGGSTPQVFIGADTCNTQTLSFNWDLGAGNPVTGSAVQSGVASTTQNCLTGTIDKPVAGTPQSQTGTQQVTAPSFFLNNTDGGVGGCAGQYTSVNPYNAYYCVQVRTGTNTPTQSGYVTVSFATVPPTPPVSVGAASGDAHLRVSWQPGNAGENITTYDVHVLASADAGIDLSRHADRVSAQTTSDVTRTDDGTPLQNGQTYTVSVVATDAYGNNSDPSQSTTGTPEAVLDFYGLYKNDGGNAVGAHGCSSAGAGLWVVALGVAAGFAARRRRRGTTALLLLLAAAPAARAAPAAYRRPDPRWLFAFKIDRYDPKVDSEAGLTGTPYHDIFGSRVPLRYQLEADWQVAHPFGSFLVGATIGFWQNYGKGRLATDTTQASGDTALLDVIPFGVVATYRFDWLAERHRWFPLVPYAQAGLTRALWASFSGTGAISRAGGARGSGWTYGYTTALGVAAVLDAIDPGLALEAYNDVGIQRTSLFAEYGWTRLDNFHSGTALILTDRAWRFGLSMEF